MSLAPLLAAPLSTQVHAFAAMAAFALGAVQLAAPKGTLPHRTIGWLWVALMVTVTTTSFWIHDLRVWGQWSPIHLLSIFTLIMLPPAVIHAMRHRVENHRKAMTGLFTGALLIAGVLHLLARPHHACGLIRRLSGGRAEARRGAVTRTETRRRGSTGGEFRAATRT